MAHELPVCLGEQQARPERMCVRARHDEIDIDERLGVGHQAERRQQLAQVRGSPWPGRKIVAVNEFARENQPRYGAGPLAWVVLRHVAEDAAGSPRISKGRTLGT